MGSDGMGSDGVPWGEMGLDGIGFNGMGLDAIRWGEMGWDGMG